MWGHFSHIYPQGTSLYVILTGRAADDATAVRQLEAVWETAMRVCLEEGSAIAHHHGVGLACRPWLSEALSEALSDAAAPLRAVKAALDPHGLCNPGKLTDPAGTT